MHDQRLRRARHATTNRAPLPSRTRQNLVTDHGQSPTTAHPARRRHAHRRRLAFVLPRGCRSGRCRALRCRQRSHQLSRSMHTSPAPRTRQTAHGNSESVSTSVAARPLLCGDCDSAPGGRLRTPCVPASAAFTRAHSSGKRPRPKATAGAGLEPTDGLERTQRRNEAGARRSLPLLQRRRRAGS
jgi:hypothetical protein